MNNGLLKSSGTLYAQKIPARRALTWRIRNALRWSFLKGWIAFHVVAPIANLFGVATVMGTLEAVLIRADGTRVKFGVLGHRVVTTAFVGFVTDQLQTETSVFGDFKFHDSGVGTTAEAIGDTGIETTDGESRATGTQTESAANAYRSVGTISYTTTKAITEHGLFNDASAGTLAKQANKTLSGVLTSAGALVTNMITGKSVDGTLPSSGTLTKQTNKTLAGTLTSAGNLTRQAAKTLSGTLTSTGALLTSLIATKSADGTLASTGTLTKQVNKVVSGVLTSAGELLRQTNKSVGGSVTPSGALSRQTNKRLAGTLAPAGTLTTTFIPGGTTYTQTISGTLPSSGTLVTTFIPAPAPSEDLGGYADGGGLYLSERRRTLDTSPKFNLSARARQLKEDEEILILS